MSAQSTVGVTLESGAGDPIEYGLFGCIHDINGPDITVTSNDGTCLTSEDAWKEFVAGFKDGGEVTLTVNRQDGDDFNDYLDILRVMLNWRITYPNGALTGTILFAGFITKVGQKYDFDGIQVEDVSIKVSGPVTATAPA